MNWYIVQAYSGFENKVADTIKDIMSKSSLETNLGEILVPTHKVVEVMSILFFGIIFHGATNPLWFMLGTQ